MRGTWGGTSSLGTLEDVQRKALETGISLHRGPAVDPGRGPAGDPGSDPAGDLGRGPAGDPGRGLVYRGL